MTGATKTVFVIALLLVLAGCSQSPTGDRADYVDRLDRCRAIGETSNIAVQPNDRLWWDQNCADYRLELAKEKVRRMGEELAGPSSVPPPSRNTASTPELAKLAGPYLKVAQAMDRGTTEASLKTLAADLPKPSISRDKESVEYTWQAAEGMNRCTFNVSMRPKGQTRTKRATLVCHDLLAGGTGDQTLFDKFF